MTPPPSVEVALATALDNVAGARELHATGRFAMAVSRGAVDEGVPPFGYEPLGYMIRIVSYLFIIAGILYKNTSARTSRTIAPRHTSMPQEYLP